MTCAGFAEDLHAIDVPYSRRHRSLDVSQPIAPQAEHKEPRHYCRGADVLGMNGVLHRLMRHFILRHHRSVVAP